MPEEINHRRRQFFAIAGASLADARFGAIGSANRARREGKIGAVARDQAGDQHVPLPRALKQYSTPLAPRLLNVGYAEPVRPTAPSSSCCTAALRYLPFRRCDAAAGAGRLPRHRAVSARLWQRRRSCPRTPSGNGQPTAVGSRFIALMDALKIREGDARRASTGGARTADIMAVLWPEAARPWFR